MVNVTRFVIQLLHCVIKHMSLLSFQIGDFLAINRLKLLSFGVVD